MRITFKAASYEFYILYFYFICKILEWQVTLFSCQVTVKRDNHVTFTDGYCIVG